MCVIIHLPANKILSKDMLKACYDTNRDGWGIMTVENNTVVHAKNITPFEDFYKTWECVNPELPRAIHFRIRTVGDISQENCHPFFPNNEVGIMHNGYIDTVLTDAGMSDTHNFVKYEVSRWLEGYKEANRDFLTDPTFAKVMEKLTGMSKLLFMTGDGTIMKLRTQQWVERDGCSFSNGNSFHKLASTTSYFHRGSHSHYNHNYKSYQSETEETVEENIKTTTASLRAYVDHPTDELHLAWQEELNRTEPPEKKVTIEGTTKAVVIIGTEKEASTTFPLTYDTSTKQPNTYAPLKEAVVELTEKTVISDLYQGNKTDEEGREDVERRSRSLFDEGYLDEMQRLQAEDDAQYAAEVAEGEAEEGYDEVDSNPLSIDQAFAMPPDELLDWVENFNVDAANLIDDLLNQLADLRWATAHADLAGSTQRGEEATVTKKSAVNT